MKRISIFYALTFWIISVVLVASAATTDRLEISRDVVPGNTKPIYISISGFSGETASVVQNDLYVQGFAVTNSDAAQYLLDGSNNGNLQGRATDRFNKSVLVSKAYSGASLRRQAHAFADDFVQSLGRKGIAQTKIAFKGV